MDNDLESFKQHFEDFLNTTDSARKAAELRRDFRDLNQWTEKERKELEARQQAPIVFDYYSKTIDGFIGIETQSRSDPKAYPRTPKHEKASEAITDALRYVEDRTQLDEIASEAFEEKLVEGYGGAIVEVNKTKNGFEIEVNQVYWDRFYYDPHSRRKDFKDAMYMGFSIWSDVKDAAKRFKIKDPSTLFAQDQEADGTTFEDRPNHWVDSKRKRVRINQEYYIKDGVWHEVFYTGGQILKGPKPSPYFDCEGDPTNPIEMESDYVDRDNNRYGYAQRLLDPQKEVNHRRSKALYMLSSAQVIAEKGAFGEKGRWEVLQELRKAQGFIEKMPGTDVEIDRNIDMGTAQLQFYEEAKGALDQIGINPELQGRTESAISGRAFIARQQGGMVEIARVMGRHSEWKKRIYTQIYARIKQFWDEEKWIRVTDDENALKWVGLNVEIPLAAMLVAQESGKQPVDIVQQHGEDLEQIIQQRPELGQVVEVVNNLAEIDMDILIEEAPDTITIQQEQFEVLANLAGANVPPPLFEMLVELSSIRNKKAVLDKLNGDEEQQAAQAEEAQRQQAMQEAAFQADLEGKAADIENKQADTQQKMINAGKTQAEIEKLQQEAVQKALENLGMRKHDPEPKVVI